MRKPIIIGLLVLSILFLGTACGEVVSPPPPSPPWDSGGGQTDGGDGGGKIVPPVPIEKELTYRVIDDGMERECGAARFPPQFPPADFIKAYVELQNTDSVGGEFRVDFYFTTDEQNYTNSDTAYISAGGTKTFYGEAKVEIWESLGDWHYEITPDTKTVWE